MAELLYKSELSLHKSQIYNYLLLMHQELLALFISNLKVSVKKTFKGANCGLIGN